MNLTRTSTAANTSVGQKGAVLIVGLIVVLLMTIVGLAAIRGSGMQELMAGNMRDRNLAFQAAEAGLRVAEKRMKDNPGLVFNNANGLYKDLNQAAATTTLPITWSKQDWESNKSVLTTIDLDGIATAPRYVVEEMSTVPVDSGAIGGCVEFGCGASEPPQTFLRITSRGTGGSDTTEVILQSTYKR